MSGLRSLSRAGTGGTRRLMGKFSGWLGLRRWLTLARSSDDQALFCSGTGDRTSGKRARAHQESEDESGDDRAPEVDSG